MPPAPVAAPRIDYAQYTPAGGPQDYWGLKVTSGGSVVPQGDLLDSGMKRFLTENVCLNISFWDGTEGVKGVPYQAQGTLIANACVTGDLNANEIARLRELFRSLGSPRSSRGEDNRIDRLKRDLDTHAKFFNELDPMATLLKQKMETLAKVANTSDEPPLETTCGGAYSSAPLTEEDRAKASSELREVDLELVPILKAIERSQAKVATIRMELEELESTSFRRMAVLERLFSQDPRGELLSARMNTKEERDLAIKASDLTAERNKLLVNYHKILKAHVDGKKGVVFLYALEGSLKSMLENLRAVIQRGSPKSANINENSPISNAYRLKYMKKLRDSADQTLLEVLKFAPFCGISASVSGPGQNGDRWWDANSSSADVAPIDPLLLSKGEAPTLLPGFTKVSIGNIFSAKEKAVSMHDRAHAAYKAVNIAYDRQIELLKQTLRDLKSTADKLRFVEEDLIEARASILLEGP